MSGVERCTKGIFCMGFSYNAVMHCPWAYEFYKFSKVIWKFSYETKIYEKKSFYTISLCDSPCRIIL